MPFFIPERFPFTALLLACALSAALAACGDPAPVEKQEAGADAELTARVQQALTAVEAPRAEVEVRSNDGVVVLKGRVASDEEKKRIMAAAQQVPGVKWVQNQVAVIPPAPPGPPSSAGAGRSEGSKP